MLRRTHNALFPPLDPEIRDQIRRHADVNSAGFDDWGLNLDTAERTLRYTQWLYNYFRVQTHGIEHVPEGRVLLVPNHSGQLPLDGMLIAMSMLLERHRIVRGMVERWFPTVPFISTWFTRCGQVVGDPDNCVALLERDNAILVFPEGVRGSGKLYFDRYQLQQFGTGFVRMALQTNTPIVPVAVVGAEETYPAIYSLRPLARLLGMPYVPITPTWPLLGPLGLIPLPVKVDLHFGKPIHLDLPADPTDVEVTQVVNRVKGAIHSMLRHGLEQRPELQALSSIPGIPR